MKHFIDTAPNEQSTLGELRRALDETEPRIVVMHETPTGAIDVIRNLDRITLLLDALDEPKYDTRAEEGRADALRERLLRQASRVVGQVQRNGLAGEVENSATWQSLVAAANERRRQQRLSLIRGGIGTVIGVILLFVVLPRVLPEPVPTADISAVSRQVAAGDISSALATAQAEQARVPDDPDIALWIGALQQQQGDPTAEASYERARQLYGDDLTFHVERGLILTQLQQYDAAEADARQLIETSNVTAQAQGHYLIGSIAEMRGQYDQAIASFEESARLAEPNNPELLVAARSRIAFLLQRGPPLPTVTP
jgi:tetratricopeptide (TPR) repeat protein